MHDKSEKVRRVSQLVVLSSLTIVLRVVFGPLPNIKPLTAIFLIVLSYFSLLESWILMILVMVGSGLLFGFGTVVLWQVLMFCFYPIYMVVGNRSFYQKREHSLVATESSGGDSCLFVWANDKFFICYTVWDFPYRLLA